MNGSRQLHIVCSVCLLGMTLLVPGCRKDGPSFEVVSLEGKIEKIEQTADREGVITVLFFSEKHGQEMLGTGTVNAETEIMINGALAKLADLREGDRVRGEVRVDKKGKNQTRTAIKIYVERPKPVGG